MPRRHTPGADTDTGFTLIELLVVILIIGVLAGVAIPVFLSQRDKAAAGATKATMRNHTLLVVAARENQQKAMKDITSVCSWCACRDAATLLRVSDTGFAATTCGTRWRTYVTLLSAASGEPVEAVERMSTDGWGYPMMLDENEGEYGTCGTASTWDALWSAGPDHRVQASPDNIMYTIPPSGACTPL